MISKLSYYLLLIIIVVYYNKFLCVESPRPKNPPSTSELLCIIYWEKMTRIELVFIEGGDRLNIYMYSKNNQKQQGKLTVIWKLTPKSLIPENTKKKNLAARSSSRSTVVGRSVWLSVCLSVCLTPLWISDLRSIKW